MPQIFHPSMNTLSRVSIFGALFFLAAAIALMYILVRSPYATQAGVVKPQPVPFSHQHHVADAGIDCRYCHHTVETSSTAGMPSTEVCLNCHSELWRDSPLLKPVHESFRDGKPLKWTRVHDLPDFAYFDHSIHVRKGVACETCHGRVDRMPLMWRAETLHMEWCLNCHRHPERYVRPPDQVFTLGWEPASGGRSELPLQSSKYPSSGSSDEAALQPAQDASQQDRELAEASSLSSKTNCSVCHR